MERLVQMVLRQIARRVINKGINVSMRQASKLASGGKPIRAKPPRRQS